MSTIEVLKALRESDALILVGASLRQSRTSNLTGHMVTLIGWTEPLQSDLIQDPIDRFQEALKRVMLPDMPTLAADGASPFTIRQATSRSIDGLCATVQYEEPSVEIDSSDGSITINPAVRLLFPSYPTAEQVPTTSLQLRLRIEVYSEVGQAEASFRQLREATDAPHIERTILDADPLQEPLATI